MYLRINDQNKAIANSNCESKTGSILLSIFLSCVLCSKSWLESLTRYDEWTYAVGRSIIVTTSDSVRWWMCRVSRADDARL